MNFPLVPLPIFLVEWSQFLANTHFAVALVAAMAFGFCGLLLLSLWVPVNEKERQLMAYFPGEREHRRKRITEGVLFLAIASLSAVFGLYFFVILDAGILVFFSRSLFSSFTQKPLPAPLSPTPLRPGVVAEGEGWRVRSGGINKG